MIGRGKSAITNSQLKVRRSPKFTAITFVPNVEICELLAAYRVVLFFRARFLSSGAAGRTEMSAPVSMRKVKLLFLRSRTKRRQLCWPEVVAANDWPSSLTTYYACMATDTFLHQPRKNGGTNIRL